MEHPERPTGRPGGLLSGGDRALPGDASGAGAGRHRAHPGGAGGRGGRQRRAAAALAAGDGAGMEVRAAPLALCSDNAAMIASAARYSPPLPYPGYLTRDAYARPHERRGGGLQRPGLPPVRRRQGRCWRPSAQRLGFEIRVVDIAGDPELEAAYREQIPVVFVAGCKAFKFRVDPADLNGGCGGVTKPAERPFDKRSRGPTRSLDCSCMSLVYQLKGEPLPQNA